MISWTRRNFPSKCKLPRNSSCTNTAAPGRIYPGVSEAFKHLQFIPEWSLTSLQAPSYSHVLLRDPIKQMQLPKLVLLTVMHQFVPLLGIKGISEGAALWQLERKLLLICSGVRPFLWQGLDPAVGIGHFLPSRMIWCGCNDLLRNWKQQGWVVRSAQCIPFSWTMLENKRTNLQLPELIFLVSLALHSWLSFETETQHRLTRHR